MCAWSLITYEVLMNIDLFSTEGGGNKKQKMRFRLGGRNDN